MVKHFKHGARRVCAIALSVLMLLSAWVFVAPDQAKAGGGNYKWRVYVNSRNDTGGWNSETMTVRGKDDNGNASQTDLLTVNNWKIDFKGTRDNTFGKGDQTTSKFPTQLYYYYSFGGGWTKRKIDADISLQINKNGSWVTIAGGTVYSNNSGTNSGSKTWNVDTSNYPSPQWSGITGGSTTLNVPKDSSTATTGAFSYTDGTVYDQYGATWYQTMATSISSSSGGTTGVTFSSKTVTINSSANRSGDYTLTLSQKLGGTEKSSHQITVKTWDYQVKFYDADQTTVLKSQNVDYGASASAPSTANNVLSHGAGVAAKDSDATYHYSFQKWTGDGYTTLKTGNQVKNVYANYTSAVHTPQSDYGQDDNLHWKNCTVCSYTTWGPNGHAAKSTWETDAAQHWKLCSTCSRIVVAKENHIPDSKYQQDEDGDWIQCKTCKYVTTAKAAHTWDYNNIRWNWDDYECETATLTCTKCGRTKTVNVTVSCVNTPAVCEADGSNVYTASFNLDGAHSTTKTEILEALGHDYTGAYNALAGGKHNRACVNSCNCGTFGWNGEKNASVSCTPEAEYRTDGSQHWIKCQYCSNLTSAKANHTPKDVYDTDDAQHWIECSVCGYITTAKADHQWNWVTDVNETCTTDGVQHEVCSVCGLQRSHDTVRPQWGHDWNDTEYVWNDEDHPTQLTATRTCKRGDKTETETVSVTFVDDAATCTATGMRHFTSAAFNNSAFEVQTKDVVLEIDPNNHDFTKKTKNANTLKKAATCETDAVYYLSCSRCNAISDSATFVDEGSALGHNFNGAAVNAGVGMHYYKCERYEQCNAFGVGTEKNATEGCSGGVATCTERPVCDICSTIYGNTDPDNHNFTEMAATSTYLKEAATCEDDAVYYYKCSRCIASTADKEIYGGATWVNEGSRRGHNYTGAYNALPENRHNKACRNGCGTFGLEVDGVMTKNAFVACTPSVGFTRDEDQHWIKCKYCDNLTSPKEDHVPQQASDGQTHWTECSICHYKIDPGAAHDWEWIEDTPATCETTGVKHQECSECHLTKMNGTVIPKLGHAWGDVTYTWNDDNTQVTATRVCGNDNSHVETETVSASRKVQNATCVAQGSITYTSLAFRNSAFRVQTKVVDLEINPANHAGHLKPVALKKGSCTEAGERAHYFCDACNKKFSDTAGTVIATEGELLIPAREHNMDSGIATTPATCIATGIMTFSCQNTEATAEYVACNHSYTEEIPVDPTNHDGHLSPVAVVKATCTADGVKAHWYCDACELKFSDNAGTQAISDEALTIAKRAHVWDNGQVTKVPTCAEEGVKTYSCTCAEDELYAACDEQYTETLNKDPNNHTGETELVGYVEATCTSAGYSGDLMCKGCDVELQHGHVVEIVPHDFSKEDINAIGALVSEADCTSPAIYKKSCRFCGTVEGCEETFEYGEKAPANHKVELVYTPYKAATCYAAGNEENYYCAACGLSFSDAAGTNVIEQVKIEKLEHSYTGAASSVDENTHRFQCVNGCGGWGEPVAHTWSEPTVTPATCTTDGNKSYVCTADGCTGTKVEVLTKLGHDWKKATYHWGEDHSFCTGTMVCANDLEGDGVPDHTIMQTTEDIDTSISEQSSCLKGGRKIYKALFTDTNFKDQYSSDLIPKGEHNLVQIDPVEATCLEDGSTIYWICKSCNHFFGDYEGIQEIQLAETFVPRREHDFSGMIYNNGDGTHSYACIYNCGAYGNQSAHAFNVENANVDYLDGASDCIHPATYFYSCECGAKGTSTFEGTPLGHNFVDSEGQDATCTEAGYTAHRECTRCGECEGKSIILALGHGKYLFDREASGRVFDGTFEWNTYSCSRGCGDRYTLFTIYAKDTSGNPVTGATVTIEGNGLSSSGITGRDGSFASDTHFPEGEYTVTVVYTSGGESMTATGDIRLLEGRGSGGIGALEMKSADDSGNDPGTTQPTTDNGGDSGGNSGGNNQGGNNSGGGWSFSSVLNRLIEFIRSIFSIFRR